MACWWEERPCGLKRVHGALYLWPTLSHSTNVKPQSLFPLSLEERLYFQWKACVAPTFQIKVTQAHMNFLEETHISHQINHLCFLIHRPVRFQMIPPGLENYKRQSTHINSKSNGPYHSVNMKSQLSKTKRPGTHRWTMSTRTKINC